jgi:hypothetical protein
MKRGTTWVPALAAPIAVLVHILSEAMATGRGLGAVAWEPSHLALFAVALIAMPFWFRAAGTRRLAQALVAFVGVSRNPLGAIERLSQSRTMRSQPDRTMRSSPFTAAVPRPLRKSQSPSLN